MNATRLFNALENAKKYGAIRCMPEAREIETIESARRDQFNLFAETLIKSIENFTSIRRNIKRVDPDFLKFSGLQLDFPYWGASLSLPNWLHETVAKKSILQTVHLEGIALHLREEGRNLFLCVTDQKGRTWALGHTTVNNLQTNAILPYSEQTTPVQSSLQAMKPFNEQDHALIVDRPPNITLITVTGTPDKEKILYSYLNSIEQQAEQQSDILMLPAGLAHKKINECLQSCINIPLQELKDRLKHGPIENTLFRMMDEIVLSPTLTDKNHFINEVNAKLQEKGMAISMPLAAQLLSEPLFSHCKKDGINSVAVERMMYSMIVPAAAPERKHAAKPQADVKSTREDSSKKGASGWWSGFNDAKTYVKNCAKDLEPAQLARGIIDILHQGKPRIALTAPEMSAFEHMASAIQSLYDPNDATEGVKWFVKTLESADRRRQSVNVSLPNQPGNQGKSISQPSSTMTRRP